MPVANMWFFYSLAAAVLWGAGYAVSEKIMQAGITPLFLMLFGGVIALPLYFVLAFYLGEIKPNFSVLQENKSIWGPLLFVELTYLVAGFLIYLSISEKNATLASMVEIAYPLFTFAFAWLLYREVQLNFYTALGGLLILTGIAFIYFKS